MPSQSTLLEAAGEHYAYIAALTPQGGTKHGQRTQTTLDGYNIVNEQNLAEEMKRESSQSGAAGHRGDDGAMKTAGAQLEATAYHEAGHAIAKARSTRPSLRARVQDPVFSTLGFFQ